MQTQNTSLTAELPRILDKLDFYLGREEIDNAKRHLEYFINEADFIGDLRTKLTLLNEQIGLFRKNGMKTEAEKACNEALDLIQKLGISNDISGATTYLNTATAYESFKECEKALEFYEKARGIYEKYLAPDDERMGALYNNIALSLSDNGRYEEALEAFKKAVSIMTVNRKYTEVAISYLNMAELNEALDLEGREPEVENCLKEAEKCITSKETVHDGNYAYAAEKCAPGFLRFGYFALANELFEEADRIRKTLRQK